MTMEEAYKEIQRCLENNQHNVSTETLQLALEALRTVKEQEHNGWKNYATWLVASTVDNKEDVYNFYYKLQKELKESDTPDEEAISIIGQTMMFDFGTEALKWEAKCCDTIWSSLINDAQATIDYWSVAKRFYED